MASRLKNIPSVERIEDLNLRLILSAMKERIEIGDGQRGNPLDFNVKREALRDTGILGVDEKLDFDPKPVAAQTLEVEDVASATQAPGFSGGIFPLRTITADDTPTDDDFTIAIDASLNTVTVTLLTAVGRGGRVWSFPVIDATNTVTVNPDGTETIRGKTTFVLFQNEILTIQSNNVNWIAPF